MKKTEAVKKQDVGAGYSNFKDPVGLLVRMLKSGKKAAYFTLFREGVSLLLKPVDGLMASGEKKKLRETAPSDLPLVLILGGSRSGTTLLYQTLTQYLPVSYFNNLSASFPRSPISGGKTFNRFLKKKKGDFSNFYGSVAGFNGANDGFHIWNRWFGQDRNHIASDISEETLQDLKNCVDAWHNHFKKPLLNKNNRNTLCIKEFEEAMGRQVKYVVIERDPVYVIQSLIKSREAVQGDKRVGWGLGANESSEALAEKDPFYYVDEICDQVFSVNEHLDTELQQVDADRYLRITYEEFCQSPTRIVNEVSKLIFEEEVDHTQLKGLETFKNTNKQSLDDDEFSRILEAVAKKRANQTL